MIHKIQNQRAFFHREKEREDDSFGIVFVSGFISQWKNILHIGRFFYKKEYLEDCLHFSFFKIITFKILNAQISDLTKTF